MEEFNRLLGLFGSDGLYKLKNSKVAIVGLGGVGGTVVTNLARCGVGTLIICDFDKVEITNINRQIVARHSKIGKFKTDCLEEMLLDINPEVNVTKLTCKVDESLFNQDIDIVIDCIDDVKSKIWLIRECFNRGIKVISSMGAGNKVDPTKVIKTKISKTTYDPIAKILRKEFKGYDFECVCSVEEAKKLELVSSYVSVVNTFSNLLTDMAIKYIIGE